MVLGWHKTTADGLFLWGMYRSEASLSMSQEYDKPLLVKVSDF